MQSTVRKIHEGMCNFFLPVHGSLNRLTVFTLVPDSSCGKASDRHKDHCNS
jgi:hypothetical protein